MEYKHLILYIYVGVLAFMSLCAFILYHKDKKLAERNQNRIKERTLLGFSAFGGAIGAFFGRIIFRHKTDKFYFSMTIYLSLLLELLTGAFLVWYAFIK